MASGRVVQLLLRSRLLGNGARGHVRSFVSDGDVQLHSIRRVCVGQTPWRAFASSSATDGQTSVEEPEAKEIRGTWVVKGLVLAMLTYIGMNVTPMMESSLQSNFNLEGLMLQDAGDSMVRQSIALVKVKDPYFKRTGASRLSLIATDDAKRKRIVDAGGVVALVGMLETAPDDETRREAVKALALLSHYDAAVEAMHEVGGHPLVHTLAESSTDSRTQEHTSVLVQRMDDWKINKTA